MNFKPHRREEVDLNLTPLIDVVFLLLIFFMVSTTFERKSEINIILPQSSEEVAEIRPDAVNVSVDRQGRVYINDIPLVNSQLLTIREGIRDVIAGLTDPAVVISADADATHQSVIRIMDAARQLSLTKITFSTRTDEEE